MTEDSVFDGKSVFVSGGCGSLGSSIVRRLLEGGTRRVVGFDINQSGLSQIERRLRDPRLRLFVGDVRDLSRLRLAMDGCEIVFHCGALKIIPSCEYNPMEAIKTNIIGSENIIEASLDTLPEKVVAISSDKACAPLNLYGATKLCMERLVTAANLMKGGRKTVYFCVRYGNVLGSAESVIPVWREQIEAGEPITITSENTTRFSITMNEAVDFIFRSVTMARGGEIFVPKLRAYNTLDLAKAFEDSIGKPLQKSRIGLRPGEKEHEYLINQHEVRNTFDVGDAYVIVPEQATRDTFGLRYPFDRKRPVDWQVYSSETAKKLTVGELKALLAQLQVI
jgi:FlaA1/EpsC-like NDP-sugar epimerase